MTRQAVDGTDAMSRYERLAASGALVDALVEYIATYDYVTFVELDNFLSRYMDTKGDFSIELLPNVVLWAGMSEAFVDLMTALQNSHRVELAPTNYLSYLLDGGMVSLPLAKRPRKEGYQKPHWAPVCFRLANASKQRRRKDS